MAEVAVEKLTKVFPGGVRAVAETDLQIADGEFVVLVGPSGCGKTTLLRMIAGLEEPTTGVIRIGGRTVNDIAAKDRDVAMVFQNYALYPHRSVFDNMAFSLQLRKLPKATIRERVQAAAELLGIVDILDRRPGQLSGGQQQRVALGRALVRQPAVFLFDEPLSNLDALLRTEMRRELSALHRRLQATMIQVTHDQIEAMTLGDRIVVMNAGVVQQVGAPVDVYDNPANRFVAGFLGTPPMNFLKGRVSSDGSTFECPAVQFPLTGNLAQLLRPSAGAPVTLGIRPEALQLSTDTSHEDMPSAESTRTTEARISGQIEDVQTIGSESLIYVSTDSGTIVARVDAHLAVDAEAPVTLCFPTDRACFFSTDGQRI